MKIVSVELNGNDYKLRMDVNALSEVEIKMNMGFSKVMQLELSVAMIRVLLWAGLKWCDRKMTIEKAGNLLETHLENGGSLDEISEKIGEAVKSSGLFKSMEDDDPNV